MNCHAPSWLEHLTQQGLQMVPGWIHSFPVGPGIEPAFRRGDSDAHNLAQKARTCLTCEPTSPGHYAPSAILIGV